MENIEEFNGREWTITFQSKNITRTFNSHGMPFSAIEMTGRKPNRIEEVDSDGIPTKEVWIIQENS